MKQELVDRVVAAYEPGLSAQEIAFRAGCCRNYVYKVLRAEGITGDTGFHAYNPRPVVLDLNSVWAIEFRGFFWGDGCASLVRVARHDRKFPEYQPQLHVRQRADGWDMLKDFQEKLGGNVQRVKERVTPAGYHCAPGALWQVTGYSRVRAILETSLLGGVIPAKKREDIDLLYEAILARFQMPLRLGQKNRGILDRFVDRMQQIKRYKGSGG